MGEHRLFIHSFHFPDSHDTYTVLAVKSELQTCTEVSWLVWLPDLLSHYFIDVSEKKELLPLSKSCSKEVLLFLNHVVDSSLLISGGQF